MKLLILIVNDALVIGIAWIVFSRFGNLVVKLKHKDFHNIKDNKHSVSGSSLYTHGNKEDCGQRQVQIQNMENRIKTIETDFGKLESLINQIQARIQAQVPTQTQSPPQISQPHVDADTRVTKYASAFSISPNCCFNTLLDVNNRSVKFILTLGTREGTYVINDSPDAQQSVISSFNAISQMVEIKEQVITPSRVVTVIPGKLEKNGDSWIVVKKVEVKLL